MADPAFRSDPAEPTARPADPLLKVVPPRPAAASRAHAARLAGAFNKYRRFILLVVIPAIAALVALTVFLTGGRYITTDNAYVGAQKVLITPDVAGEISRVMIVEGQRAKAGANLAHADPTRVKVA